MKFLYRFKISVLASLLCVSTVFAVPVCAEEESEIVSVDPYNMEIQSNTWENWPAGPQVYAESAIVMEASTGTILYSKNIDDRHYPASITKIMTVLLALENLDLDEEVTFSHDAVYSVEVGSSSIWRNEGEILTVEQCLYAIMLESANDCANAIAEQVAGSMDAFADMMNDRAYELGCTNTHFVNAHGLPDDDHYTTAHDMALITQEAIKNEKFRQISGTARYTIEPTNKNDETLYMSNHHYMISNNKTSKYLDETVFAGKTGYTTAALNTLVTCATRNGMDLIVVTMKTQGTGETGVPTVTDTANLLNYAGENFHKVNISQNETNFTIGQNELFNTGSSIFGTSAPIIEMDTDGYIILPVTAAFSDASPQLEFVDEEDSSVIACLSYTYAGQRIGSTELRLTENEIPEFNFQKTTDGEDPETVNPGTQIMPGEKNLIKINLHIVGLAAGILILIGMLIFLIRKMARDYSVDLNLIRRFKRWRDNRNSFGNQSRRRYRSWKRRHKNRKL